MKWSIPAKTFLLGEYAALAGSSAMILTTTPCFEVLLSDKPGLDGIHDESPAGRWWIQQCHEGVGLQWHDPYHGRGGLGASSAQFIGAYLASVHVQKKTANQQALLNAYWQCVAEGAGLRPSGYDVLAQSLCGCVYINRQKNHCQSFSWPFQDVGFFLVHTGKKLATHHHLQAISLPSQISELAFIVDLAKEAMTAVDGYRMVDAVNAYHQQLAHMNLVAEHSMQHIDLLREQSGVLAMKGCGAMGADVLLLLVSIESQAVVRHQLLLMGLDIIATHTDLYDGTPLV